MIKTIKEINYQEILESYYKIEENIVWTNYVKGKQAGIQYCDGEDPWTSAVGKGYGSPTLCNNLNPFFKNTIFEKIIQEFNIYRTRFMWVSPMSCYSLHKDLSYRLHIPLVTNIDCYFLFRKTGLVHLPCGKVYEVNSREEHTFINCSEKPRLHIVGCLDY